MIAIAASFCAEQLLRRVEPIAPARSNARQRGWPAARRANSATTVTSTMIEREQREPPLADVEADRVERRR